GLRPSRYGGDRAMPSGAAGCVGKATGGGLPGAIGITGRGGTAPTITGGAAALDCVSRCKLPLLRRGAGIDQAHRSGRVSSRHDGKPHAGVSTGRKAVTATGAPLQL